MGTSRLTILFEDPFWIGLYEREDDTGYAVCRIVFIQSVGFFPIVGDTVTIGICRNCFTGFRCEVRPGSPVVACIGGLQVFL